MIFLPSVAGLPFASHATVSEVRSVRSAYRESGVGCTSWFSPVGCVIFSSTSFSVAASTSHMRSPAAWKTSLSSFEKYWRKAMVFPGSPVRVLRASSFHLPCSRAGRSTMTRSCFPFIFPSGPSSVRVTRNFFMSFELLPCTNMYEPGL